MDCVLIAMGESLTAAAVEELSKRNYAVSIIRIPFGDTRGIRDETERRRPLAIILDGNTATAQLMQTLVLLQPYSGMRILIVNDENNAVQIYDRRDILLRTGADLIDADE